MQTEITPESSKIIEEMSWQYSQYDQAASAHMDGMLAAITSPELLQAQNLGIDRENKFNQMKDALQIIWNDPYVNDLTSESKRALAKALSSLPQPPINK